MKIIRNSIIPFPGYKAMNLFGLLFVRKNAVIGSVTINHEEIHTAQMKEMLYVFFYLWYAFEFLLRLLCTWSWRLAYRGICFEREAYLYEGDMEYLRGRGHFCWIKHIFNN